MPTTHRVTITGTGAGPHEVTIDGVDIARSLSSLTLRLAAGEVPTMSADLLLLDITEIQDAETRVYVPEATAEALVALGWTPPPDSA